MTAVMLVGVALLAAPGASARKQAPNPLLTDRVASYVREFIDGLSDVVAEEAFEFSPKRKITSDFLLVRYPGAQLDLLMFRDVTHVNGAPRTERTERLTHLFLQPFDSVLKRANEITNDAGQYVPTKLNPLWAICFLQAEFQPRFRLTVQRADNKWPPDVRTLTFLETVRPTLLRSGPRGERDVPARGTAWVHEPTGRILETEVQVRQDNVITSLRTTFGLDDRLGVLVPNVMRTQRPDGTATYSNFRRFVVQTQEAIALPKDR
jgi:hypothetical protein